MLVNQVRLDHQVQAVKEVLQDQEEILDLQVILVLLEMLVLLGQLVHLARLEAQEHKEALEMQERLDQLDRAEVLVQADRQDLMDSLAVLGLEVMLVCQGRQVHRALLGSQDLWDPVAHEDQQEVLELMDKEEIKASWQLTAL